MENYTPGYSDNAVTFMTQRTVDTYGAFFKPYLQQGMRLLDCGCGPGSITLGLADLVAPGNVTGVDQAASQIDLARKNAAQQGIGNVTFHTASAYSLPFPNSSFDGVFSHALMEHLQQPVNALNEFLRVLKPGGVIGIRSPDWGGFLVAPSNSELDVALSYYKRLQQRNGGDLRVGRQLRTLLRQAGFTSVKASASYECYEPVSRITEYLALRIEASETEAQDILGERTNPEALVKMARSLRELSQHPDGFFAQSWCEAIGTKAPAPE